MRRLRPTPHVQKEMGAVGLEPTQTEVERFTVKGDPTNHNNTQILTKRRLNI